MGKRVLIAAAGSGSGKTSVVCGLIGALTNKNKKVTSFKCGPDYIDPLFHKSLFGVNSYNLDVFLSGENGVKNLLAQKSAETDISIIEGVMGFYDGMLNEDFKGSSCHISNITNTPVILVINCKGKSASVVAEIKGFMEFVPNLIKGVILNNINPHMFAYYKETILKYLDVQVVGYLPRNKEYAIDERRLGLTIDEEKVLKQKLELLGETITKTVDLRAVEQIASTAPVMKEVHEESFEECKVKIAVARDEAFLFGYDYNLELLQKMGAEIAFFSPLHDDKLPQDINGLILGSGYIADYAYRLSENKGLLKDIKEKVKQGLPTIAEGGGNILLCEKYFDGKKEYPFSGCIDTEISQADKKAYFGYHYLTANEDNLLCKSGAQIPVHEFHYFSLRNWGKGFTAFKPAREENKRNAVFVSPTLYAGLPYLYFCGNEFLAQNFVKACCGYKKEKCNG